MKSLEYQNDKHLQVLASLPTELVNIFHSTEMELFEPNVEMTNFSS